ncbi:MAG: hypothetical protein COA45_10930 [Zetaproteobacteria bacterium]|nr:MAG: hypothetical protein COA45_10930 [Zetaproteobacteria bacterium]
MVDRTVSVLTLDYMVEHIARGHAFEKHVQGYDPKPFMQGLNAFCEENTNAYFDKKAQRDVPAQRLGDNLFVETPDDLADYIKNNFLKSPHTTGYVAPENGGVNLYNSKDNVALHFSWNNKQYDFGTIYRYPTTQQRFENGLVAASVDTDGVVPFKNFDNAKDSNAAINAVESMISDIVARPEIYLFNSNNPDSTVKNRVLGRENRPGRDMKNDEVLYASHNVNGHSRVYAENNAMDISSEEFDRVKHEMAQEINIGRAKKSLRSSKTIELISTVPEFVFEHSTWRKAGIALRADSLALSH